MVVRLRFTVVGRKLHAVEHTVAIQVLRHLECIEAAVSICVHGRMGHIKDAVSVQIHKLVQAFKHTVPIQIHTHLLIISQTVSIQVHSNGIHIQIGNSVQVTVHTHTYPLGIDDAVSIQVKSLVDQLGLQNAIPVQIQSLLLDHHVRDAVPVQVHQYRVTVLLLTSRLGHKPIVRLLRQVIQVKQVHEVVQHIRKHDHAPLCTHLWIDTADCVLGKGCFGLGRPVCPPFLSSFHCLPSVCRHRPTVPTSSDWILQFYLFQYTQFIPL